MSQHTKLAACIVYASSLYVKLGRRQVNACWRLLTMLTIVNKNVERLRLPAARRDLYAPCLSPVMALVYALY